mmetsp:Transcript_88752/g.160015  ORF Transcript_88752/g.160015 Transcript_88752/m.160015 type:complete len:291 (+) Transcript_88752:218-1090(+)
MQACNLPALSICVATAGVIISWMVRNCSSTCLSDLECRSLQNELLAGTCCSILGLCGSLLLLCGRHWPVADLLEAGQVPGLEVLQLLHFAIPGLHCLLVFRLKAGQRRQSSLILLLALLLELRRSDQLVSGQLLHLPAGLQLLECRCDGCLTGPRCRNSGLDSLSQLCDLSRQAFLELCDDHRIEGAALRGLFQHAGRKGCQQGLFKAELACKIGQRVVVELGLFCLHLAVAQQAEVLGQGILQRLLLPQRLLVRGIALPLLLLLVCQQSLGSQKCSGSLCQAPLARGVG